MLRWARKTAGYDVAAAAQELKQSEERLLQWEQGKAYPSIAQLRRMSDLYKRPTAVFYLPEPPQDFSVQRLPDFRRFPDGERHPLSPHLIYLIREAHERQEWAAQIRQEMGMKPLSFVGSVTGDEPPDVLAQRIREILDVRMEDQVSWRSTVRARRQWVESCEAKGVIVFQLHGVDPQETRGLALMNPLAPTICLNSRDVDSARVFTLIHEFTHILLGIEGISDLRVAAEPRTRDEKREVYCNAVAAETLVPSKHLQRTLRAMAAFPLEDKQVGRLAGQYSVSREVIARRLLTLKYISRTTYEEMRARFLREYEKAPPKGESEGGPSYARTIVSRRGRAFTRLVFDAYADSLITLRDVSSLLGVKVNHLESLKPELTPLTSFA
jgi:Zn-dependent peptidase ImmA (M78 family)